LQIGVVYVGFNDSEIERCDMPDKAERIVKIICSIAGCKPEDVLLTTQASYNGKRHITLQSLDSKQPEKVCRDVAYELSTAGFNVIILQPVLACYWNPLNEC